MSKERSPLEREADSAARRGMELMLAQRKKWRAFVAGKGEPPDPYFYEQDLNAALDAYQEIEERRQKEATL